VICMIKVCAIFKVTDFILHIQELLIQTVTVQMADHPRTLHWIQLP
jgi:hypothetical protein